MKRSSRLLLSLVLVVCMAIALTVPAFAAGESTAVSFNGLEDIVFVYGGKSLSMAEELESAKLSVSVMNEIWKHFTKVAAEDSLSYTFETQDTDFVVTITDKTFVAAFQLKNIPGDAGYVNVQVLAAADGKELDTVKIYLWRGDDTANAVDTESADASLNVKLGDNDAAIVKLTSSSFSFFNAPKGFTFSGAINGGEATSRGEFLIHYRYLTSAIAPVAPAKKSDDSGTTESDAPAESEDEIIPWKTFDNLIDHPTENDHGVNINVGDVNVEVGNNGWGVSQGTSSDFISFSWGDQTFSIVPHSGAAE